MRFCNLCLLICCLCLAPTAFALRCGTQVIDRGDSFSRVYRFCGEPESVRTRSVYRTRGGSRSNLVSPAGDHVSAYDEVTVEVVLESWEYNFGPRRLAREIIFEDGVVSEIKSVGYGY